MRPKAPRLIAGEGLITQELLVRLGRAQNVKSIQIYADSGMYALLEHNENGFCVNKDQEKSVNSGTGLEA